MIASAQQQAHIQQIKVLAFNINNIITKPNDGLEIHVNYKGLDIVVDIQKVGNNFEWTLSSHVDEGEVATREMQQKASEFADGWAEKTKGFLVRGHKPSTLFRDMK
jgi:hypothetical protein